MPEYTTGGIQYPIAGDLIKQDSIEAKLANDLQALAQSANTAINVEGERAERDAKTAAATDATTKADSARTAAINDATTKYGELPEKVVDLEATAPEARPVEGALVSITDSSGRSTWLEANAVDGGPTEWAAQHIRKAAGVVPSEEPAVDRGVNRQLWAEGPNGLQRIVSDPSTICCWGDSLTDGDPQPYVTRETAWPAILDNDYAAGTTFNAGLGGLCSDEIAFRQGGYVLTVDALTIPASGGVTLSIQNVIRWRLGTWSFPVALAGIPGTFSRASGVSTFTRTVDGDPIAVPPGEPIRSDWGTEYAENVQVIFAGRNDISQDPASPAGSPAERTIAAVVAMVERLTPKHPRVLVIGPTTATNETIGTTGYGQVIEIAQRLQNMYPESFYDLRAYLVSQCIHDLGITPTTADQDAMAGDTLPPSIMVPGDVLHFDAPAHAQVGHRVYEQLRLKGWIPA